MADINQLSQYSLLRVDNNLYNVYLVKFRKIYLSRFNWGSPGLTDKQKFILEPNGVTVSFRLQGRLPNEHWNKKSFTINFNN